MRFKTRLQFRQRGIATPPRGFIGSHEVLGVEKISIHQAGKQQPDPQRMIAFAAGIRGWQRGVEDVGGRCGGERIGQQIGLLQAINQTGPRRFGALPVR